MKLKIFSIVIIIISACGFAVGEAMAFINNMGVTNKVSAVSLIGVGIGAILLGVYQIKERR